MDIELTVRSPKGSLPGWRYQIVGTGTPTVTTGDTATLTVADGANATLKILPPAPTAASPAWRDDPTAYWPLDLAITWNGGQANVDDPYHQVDVRRAGGGLKLSVVLSRVRNASAMFTALDSSKDWPPENTKAFLFARRNGPRALGPKPEDLIDEGGKIRRTPPLDTISTTDDLLLFEIAPPRRLVKGQEKLARDFRPKLVGGYFAVPVTKANLYVYYYPQIDQDPTFSASANDNNLRRDSDDPDDARLGVNHYPKAHEHLDRVIFGKLFYGSDPWSARQQYMAGLAHQVAAAARPLGIVIPIPDLEPVAFADKGQTALSLGVAVFPEDLHEIVREIWAYVRCLRLRRPAVSDSALRPAVADARTGASLDRVVVSGFSNGNHFLDQLTKRIAALPSPAALPFRDFIALDPPPLYAGVEQSVRKACDKLPDSRLYYYWRYGYDIATRESGNPRTLKGSDAYQAALEGRFFYAHLPASTWPLPPIGGDMDMHAWIDATMVCDAIKCSVFPVDPTKSVP